MREGLFQENSKIINKLFNDSVVVMTLIMIANASTAMIDGILTSRFLGGSAMTAYGIASVFYSATTLLRSFIMAGCTTVCTRAIGKHDMEKLSSAFTVTIILIIAIASIWLSSGLLFSQKLAVVFGARESQITLTASYLQGVFLGSPALLCYVLFINMIHIGGNTSSAKTVNIILAVVDIAGDIITVLLFRKNIISLNAAMFGMGFASAVSHIAALLVTLPYFFSKECIFKFSLKSVRLSVFKEIVTDGLWKVLSQLSRVLDLMITYPLVFYVGGSLAAAGFAVLNNAVFVAAAVNVGISNAVLVMAGMSFGEQDINGMESVVIAAFKNIIFRVCPISIIIIFAAPYISAFYVPADNPEVRALACMALRCYALSLPFISFNSSCSSYFLAAKRRYSSCCVNWLTEFVVSVSMAFLLSKFWGVTGLFVSMPAAQILLMLAIITVSIFLKNNSVKGVGKFLMLPPDFGTSDFISARINNIQEAVAFSSESRDFCMRHNFDRKRAFHVSLCIEELSANVIQHGFKTNKNNNLDVRLAAKDGGLILRLRDDCELFNIKKMADKWKFDPDNLEHHIGTRLIMQYARDIQYVNIMNTNNLTVIL